MRQGTEVTENNLKGSVIPSTMWVLGVQFSSPNLATSAFTQKDTLLPVVYDF